MTSLPISAIRTDGGTQPRAAIDYAAVDDYTDAMQAGVKFPPITVFYDGAEYWLADGFHRCEAAFGAGLKEISCDIQQGTQQDAQWYSFSANKANGLRRTNEDKQRAVKAALQHPGGAGKSDHQIAKHVGVDVKTVGTWRGKLTMEIPQSTTRTGSDGRTINTANIGKKPVEIRQPEPKVEAPQPAPGKRQQILATAARRRIIDGLSLIKGACRGLAGESIFAVCDGWPTEDIGAFADIAAECSKQLHALHLELLKRATERRTA